MLKGVFEQRAIVKTIHHWIIRSILALAVACLAAPARAQLVPDGGTNIVDGVFADGGVTNYIGSNTPFSLLVITNGGGVTNVTGIIGLTTNSVSNTAVVGGTGSYWQSIGSGFPNGMIVVGSSGAFNTLVIRDGGRVEDATGAIGHNRSAVSNQATITGAGSVWASDGDFYVGYSGGYNSLLIADGGTVISGTSGVSTIGFSPSSPSNHATVTGANSLWTVSNSFRVGVLGSFNTLLISNGGRVASASGSIGAGSNNQVTVSGSNSAWICRDGLRIGESGRFNTLLVTNGGTVQAASAYVGFFSNAFGNLLDIENGFFILTNATANSILDVRRGELRLGGGALVTSTLMLTNAVTNANGGGGFTFNGGTLMVQTSIVANAQTFFVGNGTGAATFSMFGKGTHTFSNGLLIQTNATLTGTGTINGSVTNCGTIFLTNADQMIFTGDVVNKGVIIAVTGTPRFGSTFTNFGTLITTASINVANVSVSGPDIMLQFNSVSNYVHEVQASTNVSSGLWQSLTNGLLGTGSPITFTDPGGATNGNRTYRVLLH